jgi:hypothetical protein
MFARSAPGTDLNYCPREEGLTPLIRARCAPAQQTLTAFHLTERRISSRRRGVRQQSRVFAHRDPRLKLGNTLEFHIHARA